MRAAAELTDKDRAAILPWYRALRDCGVLRVNVPDYWLREMVALGIVEERPDRTYRLTAKGKRIAERVLIPVGVRGSQAGERHNGATGHLSVDPVHADTNTMGNQQHHVAR
jgi:hypothetical protein